MSYYIRYDVSFLSILLLSVLYLTIQLRKEGISTSGKLMKRLIIITIYMLFMEILSWTFDQKQGRFYFYANYFTNMLFAWSTPMITAAWASYFDYQIFSSYARLKKRWFYIYPLIINTVFILINFFTPFIFSVSPENVYQREPFMWLIVIVNTVTFLYICKMSYQHRNQLRKEVIIILLIYVIMPLVAAAVQVLIYGAFIIWPIMAVTIVLTYIFIETISTATDYLTGLMSRHRADEYIEYMLQMEKDFALIVMDLDHFKMINDTYGHHIGDQALKYFSKALKQVFKDAKLIARYGGDEFICVVEKTTKEEVVALCQKLDAALESLKKEQEITYEIAFSYGFEINNPSMEHTYTDLFKLADQEMYQEKSRHHKMTD